MNLAGVVADTYSRIRGNRNGPAPVPQPESGKPLDRPDPTPKQSYEDVVHMVRERYDYARRAKLPMIGTWATCLAFTIGGQRQWSAWDDRARRMVRWEDMPKWRVAKVDNQFPNILRGLASRLTRATEKPVCLPVGDDPEEKEGTENATKLLQHFWHQRMVLPEFRSNVNRAMFGGAFLHDYWDPTETAWVPVPVKGEFIPDPQAGEPTPPVLTSLLNDESGPSAPEKPRVKTDLAAVGDICCDTLTVFDVFPEPVETWQAVSWCIVARRKSVQWIEDTFEVKVEADDDTESDVLTSILAADSTMGTSKSQAGGPKGTGQATLLIYYEARSRRYPKGRHLIVCGEKLLYRPDPEHLPMPHGKIPIVHYPFDEVPKRLWGKGVIEDLIDNQVELNRHGSTMGQLHRWYSNPKRWMDLRWNVEAEDINNAVDGIIFGNFNGENPAQWLEQPPNLPQWISEYGAAELESMRNKSGLQQILEGVRPEGANTATAIVTLQREAQQGLSSPGLLGQQALKEFAERINVNQSRLYKESRFVLLLGKEKGARESYLIEKGSYGIRPVYVELTEGVQDTEELRQTQLTGWFDSAISQAPLEVQAALAEKVGLHWLAETLLEAKPVIEQQQAQQQQAQQQQMQMEQQAAEQQAGLKAQGTLQQQQAQAQGAAQSQEQQAASAQQQMAVSGAQAQQGMQVSAAQKAQELALKEAEHQQAQRHREEQHQATLKQAEAAAKVAARVKPKNIGAKR